MYVICKKKTEIYYLSEIHVESVDPKLYLTHFTSKRAINSRIFLKHMTYFFITCVYLTLNVQLSHGLTNHATDLHIFLSWADRLASTKIKPVHWMILSTKLSIQNNTLIHVIFEENGYSFA